jgi:hypothetical protein
MGTAVNEELTVSCDHSSFNADYLKIVAPSLGNQDAPIIVPGEMRESRKVKVHSRDQYSIRCRPIEDLDPGFRCHGLS